MKALSPYISKEHRATVALAGLLAILAIASFPFPASAATCPNEALRIAQSATTLPGCMGLEMVSPPKKSSQPAYLPIFSRDGQRILLNVETALEGSPGYQYYGGDRYVSSRGSGGWTTASTSPLEEAIVAGGRRRGNPPVFTPDLGRWAQLGATQTQNQLGIAQLFEGGLSGAFTPLSPLLVPISDTGSAQAVQLVENIEFAGASADLGASVLQLNMGGVTYLSNDPVPEGPGSGVNSYVAFLDGTGEPVLRLLARDKSGFVYGGRCAAHIGGDGPMGTGATFNQGAISPDGDRIYLTTRPAQPFDQEKADGPACELTNGLRIMRRIASGEGPVLAPLLPGGQGDWEEPGDDAFQAASADGTKVYLTTPRKLAASDVDVSEEPCSSVIGASQGCDLYLYDSTRPEGERVVHASEGVGPADVLSSITAVSGDGSHAYFAAQGVLTSAANPEGDTAQASQPNLYLYEADSDQLSYIGTLALGDQGALWGTKGSFFGDAYAAPLHGEGPEEGGEGHVLAFASKAPITADDEDAGHRDVFRYDATADTLQRISKAPEGGADNGPFDATVNPAYLKVIEYNFGEAGRWVSEDGQTIAFSAEEPLLPGDEDEAANPYVWHSGALGASFAEITEPPAVAPLGGQVAFATPAPLLPQDIDSVKDTYLAREGGGFPFSVAPTECDPLQEGSCRAAPPAPQAPPAPASAAFSGPGNAAKPSKCRKGQVKRRGRCVRKARKGKGAGHKRGGRR